MQSVNVVVPLIEIDVPDGREEVEIAPPVESVVEQFVKEVVPEIESEALEASET